MGIWRVLKADILCDDCEKLIAKLEFDAQDEPNIEHFRVQCIDCTLRTKTIEVEHEQ